MKEQIAGREFKIWEYRVSHGSLLIRSPAFADLNTNVDLIFKGVTFLSGPTMLGKISRIEIESGETRGSGRKGQLWRLHTDEGELLVGGAFMNIEENTREIFETNFNWT